MLNWIREKLFKRPSSCSSVNNTSFEGSNNLQHFSTLEKTDMLTESTSTQINDKITLIIILSGETWTINVDHYQVISNLIDLALNHFYSPVEAFNNPPRYKMVLISSRRVLSPSSTIADEHLKNGDEIMLVRSVSTGASLPINLNIEDIQGPTKEAILRATAHLPVKNPIQPVPSLDCQENFQSEIIKVIYSLVEASARILSASPDAEVMFDDIAARINAKTKKEIDRNAIKTLKDLGFTENQAKFALRLKRNRAVEAMEWLLENSHRVREEEEEEEVVTSGPNAQAVDKPLDKIHQLLADIREFQSRHFEPNSQALERLTAMGFSEDSVIDALRLTRNDIVVASEWLCGERDESEAKAEPGLDTDSPIYKALMNNPTIQLGLHNPKVLLALVSMVENTASVNLWLNDVDTAPVLGQVFKTYHSEKHMILVQQQIDMMRAQH